MNEWKQYLANDDYDEYFIYWKFDAGNSKQYFNRTTKKEWQQFFNEHPELQHAFIHDIKKAINNGME